MTGTTWQRHKHGIHTSACGRWSACNVGPPGSPRWRLQDRAAGGVCRYYDSLKAAKRAAECHARVA